MAEYVRRTYCSWHDSGWRSLLVQSFAHARQAEALPLPGVSDLHLVLCTSGDAVMRTHDGGRASRRRWVPGRLELMLPGHPTVRSYHATSAMRSVQVHIPRATVERTAAELGGPAPDFEALSAALGTGDAVVEHLMRALPAARDAGDLYAESAAAFLVTHLLTRTRDQPPPGPEHTAVRKGIATMRERLADTGLTIEQIAERCGFSSPGSLSSAFLRHVGVRPSVYRKM
ncbi:helix-turn-helix domain-containing protein [Actinomadura rubrisoli]|uniref:Helix-turn-helix domain-containing protein n=2 Tax=Actinomadura rubrisoli TaxID=2530368 RepID=A0A4R5B881_9ACTN|nr:helix-turn-helix domain-containing protein [Actinomadura rubrisoli]